MKLIKPFLTYRAIKVYKFVKNLDFPKIILNRKTEALVISAQKGLLSVCLPQPLSRMHSHPCECRVETLFMASVQKWDHAPFMVLSKPAVFT